MSAKRIVRVTPRSKTGFDVTLWLYDIVNKKEKFEEHKFVATTEEAKTLKRRWLGV